MKTLNKIILLCFSTILLASCGSKNEKKPSEENAQDTLALYEPNWESIKKNYKDPSWFNDQKFGIFIHWGAYSVPSYGSEWYPRQMYMDTATFSAQLKLGQEGPNNVYTYHKKKYGDQKEFGYKDFIPMFKAEKFDPKEWISLFKKAGARYVVPVADHHDGFAIRACLRPLEDSDHPHHGSKNCYGQAARCRRQLCGGTCLWLLPEPPFCTSPLHRSLRAAGECRAMLR